MGACLPTVSLVLLPRAGVAPVPPAQPAGLGSAVCPGSHPQKWDRDPDLIEVGTLETFRTEVLRCQPIRATARTQPPRGPPKSLSRWAATRPPTPLIWRVWPQKVKVCRHRQRRSRVWETLLVTLSDATSNTYCHKGSYSNTIN